MITTNADARLRPASTGEGWSFIRAGDPPLSLTHTFLSRPSCVLVPRGAPSPPPLTSFHFTQSSSCTCALHSILSILRVLWVSLVRRWNSQAQVSRPQSLVLSVSVSFPVASELQITSLRGPTESLAPHILRHSLKSDSFDRLVKFWNSEQRSLVYPSFHWGLLCFVVVAGTRFPLAP